MLTHPALCSTFRNERLVLFTDVYMFCGSAGGSVKGVKAVTGSLLCMFMHFIISFYDNEAHFSTYNSD